MYNFFPQGTSPYAREIATSLHQSLLQYKKANPTFWCNGDDSHHDRERAQILILDRNFDLLSPLMHEYTYQVRTHFILEENICILFFFEINCTLLIGHGI
jgi:hypothetical protein